ncbi:MarR family winged helix-turn-helix transcriptional regulator [Streptomyces sp. cg2]|uniref:MarR family winged helix-turn-helix transcriptional regulator n=1 Tax=Streptomyces sp. cg2 TaxID=3238799 RepID=UPI0034E28DA0
MALTSSLNLADLHQLGRRLTAAATAAMKDSSDLGSTELVVLECLYITGPQPVGAVAQHTGFAQSRVSTVIATLRERGLVELSADPADRRRTIAKIAEHARAQAKQARSQDAEPVLRQMLPEASHAQIAQTLAVLGNLHAALGEAGPESGS